MFIGYYKLDGEKYNNIYFKPTGWELWHKDTFSPNCEDMKILDFKLKGRTYKERKASLKELAIEWQLHFSTLNWSYGELADIQDYFYRNAEKYGFLTEFKENGIC